MRRREKWSGSEESLGLHAAGSFGGRKKGSVGPYSRRAKPGAGLRVAVLHDVREDHVAAVAQAVRLFGELHQPLYRALPVPARDHQAQRIAMQRRELLAVHLVGEQRARVHRLHDGEAS